MTTKAGDTWVLMKGSGAPQRGLCLQHTEQKAQGKQGQKGTRGA